MLRPPSCIFIAEACTFIATCIFFTKGGPHRRRTLSPDTPNPTPTPTILVVTPHPDDAESGAGGTIARYVAQGSKVVIVVCTNGDKGSSDHEMSPEELAALREKEQLASAKVLGVDHVSFLRFPDQTLEDDSDFRERIVREIRTHKPEIVFTMDPNRNYISHRDHRMTGRVTLDAVFPFARDHLSFPEHLKEGLEAHKVREVYLWGSDVPDTFLDVTDTFETKLQALFCHRSQVGDRADGDRESRWRQRFSEAGKRAGVPLAVSFKRIEMGY
jgi:LmbE family N-acetylglucosaminyl deacetylase